MGTAVEGCAHIWATVNVAAVTILARVFWWTCGTHPRCPGDVSDLPDWGGVVGWLLFHSLLSCPRPLSPGGRLSRLKAAPGRLSVA